MLKAILFDFDGLILDTETPEYEAWREVYAAHGCDLPLATWCDCVGRPHGFFDAYAHLESLVGRPIDRPVVRARRRARAQEMIATQAALPGVTRLLEQACAASITTAVVSSSERVWVEGHLQRLNLLRHFVTLVCREDTARHKPDPEPYLEAIRQLGLSAGEAVALEDSANGIASARAAGLTVVAIPNPVTVETDLTAADCCCRQVGDLSLAALDSLLARCSRQPRVSADVSG